MITFKCKMCGGELEFEQGASVAECPFCGTQQTLPKLDDDRRTNLYDRANHFRRQNEYDKAMALFEKILQEDRTDAEAYWSLVLCRYGIEYVVDPVTGKRIPTVNRVQYASVLADEDYKSALQYADNVQRDVYKQEAETIDGIQKGILAISSKEKPFDVFICYKETDVNGRRTPDSVLANDLYHQLTNEGFKVFFSRITLEDKIGTAYEPYIFAALNSAKVMVVLGTKPEYFNAVWVRNEWSRFLALIKSGAEKTLVPAYKDMDPYDLPEEFSHLQAQDMSKLGFMQDLIRGIKKLTQKDEPAPVVQVVQAAPVQSAGNATVDSLMRRAELFMEDGDFNSANEYLDKVLDIDPEYAPAYLGKVQASLKLRKVDQLGTILEEYENTGEWEKALRFAEPEQKERYQAYLNASLNFREKHRQQRIYNQACQKLNGVHSERDIAACQEAERLFSSLHGFFDSEEKEKEAHAKAEQLIKKRNEKREQEAQLLTIRAEKEHKKKKAKRIIAGVIIVVIILTFLYINVIKPASIYKSAVAARNAGDYDTAALMFESLGDYKDAKTRAVEIRYDEGKALLEAEEFELAANTFDKIADYKDSTILFSESAYPLAMKYLDENDPRHALLYLHRIGEYKDSKELYEQLQRELSRYISLNLYRVMGLKSDGTVVATGNNEEGQCDVENWTDIVKVVAGYTHTVGLKSDGTVVATGSNEEGQCNVENWTDIINIVVGYDYTVGLKSDGTVVATGNNENRQCNVKGWRDIVDIYAASGNTVGLKVDGTVVATSVYSEGNAENWTDIVNIAVDSGRTVGLKSDGTVVATGSNSDGECDVENWTDIVNIAIGLYHTVGLKADGTVVATGSNEEGQCNVENWTDIVKVVAGGGYTAGLKVDGTVVIAGRYIHSDVRDWTRIINIESSTTEIIGLKADGTVVSTNHYHDVEDWKLW